MTKSLKMTKGVIRSRELKDRQYNDQKEKGGNKINNDPKKLHKKLKIEQHETHKNLRWWTHVLRKGR